MSNVGDDDDDYKPRKGNTAPELKPEHGKRIHTAPRGLGPSLSATPPISRQQARGVDDSEPSKPDTRPIALRTGDKEEDAESIRTGHRLMEAEEIEAIFGEGTATDEPTENNAAKKQEQAISDAAKRFEERRARQEAQRDRSKDDDQER